MINFELPCGVGDFVYVILDGKPIPAVREVVAIRISKNWNGEDEIRFSVKNVRTKEISGFYISDFNKTVFVNKEDAKKAIESSK